MGDQQIAREMLECFRDSIQGYIESLHAHVATADQIATLAMVQKILNIATCSSATGVQECVFEMEYAAKVGNLELVRKSMPLLDLKAFEAIIAINNGRQQPETIANVI